MYNDFKKYISFFLLITFISACSPKAMKVVEFEGFSDLKKGESTMIKWHIENADSVEIQGMAMRFASKDSLMVSPDHDKKYEIRAIQYGHDTLDKNWRVYVESEGGIDPKRGPDVLKTKLLPSIEESQYLKSIRQYEDKIQIVQMKILGTEPPNYTNTVTYKVALLDNFGNQISGIQNFDKHNFTAENFCKAGSFEFDIKNISEDKYTEDEFGVSFSVLLDNSAPSLNNQAAFKVLQDFTTSLDEEDNFALKAFNQTSYNIVKLSPAEQAVLDIKSKSLDNRSGLCALYKAAFKSLVELKKEKVYNRRLVIISYSPDNSSIIYNLRDITNLAVEFGIPIYTIGIGNAVESYALKYISNATGGRYYFISENNINELGSVLREIHIGQKAHYSLKVSIGDFLSKCDDIRTEITYSNEDTKLKDENIFSIKPQSKFSKYQALASFNPKEYDIDNEYLDNLNSLVKVLRDNPTYAVELIGHSSIEGDEETCLKLGLKRAQVVRAKLIDLGAAPSQLRIRTEGSNMPIYFIQALEWQQFYNRRIELRWLDPELLPFEIIAQQSWTENEALRFVERWEELGLKSYYQRFVLNNKPIYRVKLWGFKTLQEAETTAKNLEEKFNESFVVE